MNLTFRIAAAHVDTTAPVSRAPEKSDSTSHPDTLAPVSRPPEKSDSAPRPRRRSRRLVLEIGLIAAGLLAAFATSLACGYGWKLDEPESALPPSSPSRDSLHEETQPEADPLRDGRRIDHLIRTGDFAAALRQCRAAPAAAFGSDELQVAYREALCLEAQGRWADARDAYAKTMKSTPDSSAASWCSVGQARCLMADGNVAAGRELLDRVLLRSGQSTRRGKRILEECLFLLGCADVLALPSPPPLDPFDSTALAWPPLEGGLDRYLDWLPVEEEPDDGFEFPIGLVIDAPDTSAVGPTRAKCWLARTWARRFVRFTLTERPLEQVLDIVAHEAGFALEIDAAATGKLDVKTAIDVEDAPFDAVLTALTRGLGLEWRIKADSLVIGPARPVDEASARERASVALRRGLHAAPEHPRARTARLVAANLEFTAGRTRKAADEFQQFLEVNPHAAESVYAAFNLGLIELANGNGPMAQARFFEAVDRGPDSKFADFGLWWVGRTRLDRGETQAAHKSFLQARDGRTKPVASAAGLGLAVCAVLEGDVDEARQLLQSQRTFDRDSHWAVEEFLTALVSYRGRPTEARGDRVEKALQHIGEGRILGASGYLLAGQVYRELGRYDRAAGLYDAAAELVRGPLAIRMTFEAAERYDQLDLRAEARQRYVLVTTFDSGEWAHRAQLRLADLAARDRRGSECVRRCRELIGRDGVERDEVLTIMGRGYELLKMHRAAADCFAGRLPEE